MKFQICTLLLVFSCLYLKAWQGPVMPKTYIDDPGNCIADAGKDQNICNQTSTSIHAKVPNKSRKIGEWTQSKSQAELGVKIEDPKMPETMVFGLEPDQTYEFIWTLSNPLCRNQAFDEVKITNHSTPTEIAFAGENQISCGSNTVLLNADAPQSGQGLWSTNNQKIELEEAHLSNALVMGLSPGENTLYWSLSSTYCTSYSVDSVTIFYEPAPEKKSLNFTIAKDQSLPISLNEVQKASDMVLPHIEIKEPPAFGDLNSLGDDFIYEPIKEFVGFDQLTFQACSEKCPDLCAETEWVIQINDALDCFIPQVITPNGDGANDRLEIDCIHEFPNAELMIFNSMGEKIFQQKSYQNDWNGLYKGKELPTGTYLYILNLNNTTNDVIQGFFMIHRS